MIIPARTVDGHPYMYPPSGDPGPFLPTIAPAGTDPDTVVSDGSDATMVLNLPASTDVGGVLVYADLPAIVFPVVPSLPDGYTDITLNLRCKWEPTADGTSYPPVGDPDESLFIVDIHRRRKYSDLAPADRPSEPRYWDFGWWILGLCTHEGGVPPAGVWSLATVSMATTATNMYGGPDALEMMADFLTNATPTWPTVQEQPFCTPSNNFDGEVWVSEAWIEFVGGGPSPLRVYPRADGLTASAQRTYPTTRARSGARITGYY